MRDFFFVMKGKSFFGKCANLTSYWHETTTKGGVFYWHIPCSHKLYNNMIFKQLTNI